MKLVLNLILTAPNQGHFAKYHQIIEIALVLKLHHITIKKYLDYDLTNRHVKYGHH